MKQDKCLFLTATIASILALYDINAYADNIACPAGKMLPAGYNRCVDCTARALTLYIPDNTNPNAFYCPGGVFVVNNDKNQGIKMCAAETVADSNHKRCEKRKVVSARAVTLTKAELNSKDTPLAKLNASSKDFLSIAKKELKLSNSDNELKDFLVSKKITSLNVVNALKEIQKNMIHCKPGTYLPSIEKGKVTKCESCPSQYACPGGDFVPSNLAAGLEKCDKDKKPNGDKTKCVSNKLILADSKFTDKIKSKIKDKSKDKLTDKNSTQSKGKDTYITCLAGQYLPINQNHCADCLENYYCEGGKWMPNASMNNGLVKCASGLVSAKGSKSSSNCVKPVPDMVTCEPGKYLPAKSKECRECGGTNKYCPGVGPIRPDSALDQGIKVCPLNTTTNKTKSACQLTLTKDMMRYGIGKTASTELDEQCWIHEEIADYEKCMFGGKLKITAPASAVKAVLKKGNFKHAEFKIEKLLTESKNSDLKK